MPPGDALEGLRGSVDQAWDRTVLPTLCDYTRVRCLSPAFDPDWRANGELHRAARLLVDWSTSRAIDGVGAEIVEREGRTPVVLVHAPGSVPGNVVVYGHLDKQPPQGEWRSGLGPYEPVRQDERLYGRGTADDGYALFAALVALETLDARGLARPSVDVLIEASEESGSPDLPTYLDALGDRLGQPDLVVCLDSGCLTYDRLWTTTSLRGNLVATVRVDVLDEGVHSGLAGGVVPSSFRVLRSLLSRIEDEATGTILLPELTLSVPESHRGQPVGHRRGVRRRGHGQPADRARAAPRGDSAADRLIAKAWSPALALTGMDGVPTVRDGGNVLRPFTTAKISLRLPPSCDAPTAAGARCAGRSSPIRPRVLGCMSRSRPRPTAGWHPTRPPGWPRRWAGPRRPPLVGDPQPTAKAAPSRSSPPWAPGFPGPNSSRPGCSDHTPTRTGPTSSSTFPWPKG